MDKLARRVHVQDVMFVPIVKAQHIFGVPKAAHRNPPDTKEEL